MKKLCMLIGLCIYALAVSYWMRIYSFNNNRNLNETKYVDFKDKIYPIYYEDKLHVEWPFSISKNYDQSKLYQWTEPKQLAHVDLKAFGEAEGNVGPYHVLETLMKRSYEKYNYNMLASDLISLNRSLPDSRSDECKNLSYPKKLPTTSVIIIFHNEGWTTLLRTIWSIINRSPPELIEEIILVDDMSTWGFLKRPLEDYIEQLSFRIKLIRTSKREGLIRARIIGAQHATANVLTFFDAHVECNEGWLLPLISRIASDRSVVAVPLIDTISSKTMTYKPNSPSLNGFRWTLIFNWMPVPERELIRNQYDSTAPIRTPTMVGCSFSLDREFFFEIGSFDKGMNIWGSENLELALRVWQCGGSIELLPCSRVGHLFRVSTYSFNGDEYQIKAQNNIRLVEVWMSDLKHLYYAANPEQKNLSAGDLTERKELKQRLKCKNFRWYLENIYPESNMLKEFIDIGRIKSVSENKCVDTYMGNSQLILYGCHLESGKQIFAFAKDRMIVTTQELCVGVNDKLYALISVECMEQDSSQLWKYVKEKQWLIHIDSGLCMKANKAELILGNCNLTDVSFQWNIISTL